MKQTRAQLEEESSLKTWYPRIVGKIPTPRTEILNLSDQDYLNLQEMLDNKELPYGLKERIMRTAGNFPEPFFLRSDQGSGKHRWIHTCYVKDREQIPSHLFNLVEWHACAGFLGLCFSALVFREYIPPRSRFTAFDGMPVAPEWRFFVRDGKPVCRHFYWPDDCILKPSRKDWLPLLHGMQILSTPEMDLLNRYAVIFGENNPGYWSVDFALTRDLSWILIDAARGEISYHDPKCEFNPEHREEKPGEENIIETLANLGSGSE